MWASECSSFTMLECRLMTRACLPSRCRLPPPQLNSLQRTMGNETNGCKTFGGSPMPCMGTPLRSVMRMTPRPLGLRSHPSHEWRRRIRVQSVSRHSRLLFEGFYFFFFFFFFSKPNLDSPHHLLLLLYNKPHLPEVWQVCVWLVFFEPNAADWANEGRTSAPLRFVLPCIEPW